MSLGDAGGLVCFWGGRSWWMAWGSGGAGEFGGWGSNGVGGWGGVGGVAGQGLIDGFGATGMGTDQAGV